MARYSSKWPPPPLFFFFSAKRQACLQVARALVTSTAYWPPCGRSRPMMRSCGSSTAVYAAKFAGDPEGCASKQYDHIFRQWQAPYSRLRSGWYWLSQSLGLARQFIWLEVWLGKPIWLRTISTGRIHHCTHLAQQISTALKKRL
jgi:hypothetical protein